MFHHYNCFVHHNPYFDGASTCAGDAVESKDNVNRQFGRQNVVEERLGVIYSRHFDKLKKKM